MVGGLGGFGLPYFSLNSHFLLVNELFPKSNRIKRPGEISSRGDSEK